MTELVDRLIRRTKEGSTPPAIVLDAEAKLEVATEKIEATLRVLQTPLSKLEKPILIESGYLKDTFYLAANADQAVSIEGGGGVCYVAEEIRVLLANSIGMNEKILQDYLNKVHTVKRTFPGARIQAGILEKTQFTYAEGLFDAVTEPTQARR